MHSLIRKLKKQEGFTLIELMIVVAIIGILAAVAIPNFIKFQLRSKASEGKINLASMRTAEESYFAEVGSYVAVSLTPTSAPNQMKKFWGVACSIPPLSSGPGVCFIGWEPEGDIYYQYGVNIGNPATNFWAAAQSDIDADTNLNTWGLKKPDLAGAVTATSPFAECTTIKNLSDPAVTDMLSQVGPCDSPDMGRNVF